MAIREARLAGRPPLEAESTYFIAPRPRRKELATNQQVLHPSFTFVNDPASCLDPLTLLFQLSLHFSQLFHLLALEAFFFFAFKSVLESAFESNHVVLHSPCIQFLQCLLAIFILASIPSTSFLFATTLLTILVAMTSMMLFVTAMTPTRVFRAC